MSSEISSAVHEFLVVEEMMVYLKLSLTRLNRTVRLSARINMEILSSEHCSDAYKSKLRNALRIYEFERDWATI